MIVDSRGKTLEEHRRIPARPGSNLTLTLDLDLQQEAERLMRDKVGAVVALDPRNGEVLALVSSPSYNPNQFARGLDPAEWQALLDDPGKPLQDRAIHNAHSPGSVFKMVMASAGLAEGVIDGHERVFCRGSVSIYGHTFGCWRAGGHGWVDLHTAIERSCNVYFYTLGQKLGIERIASYARAFGLGRPTGIDLRGEKAGLVPDPEWSRLVRRSPWFPGETISVAIGQGSMLATPLQVARHGGGGGQRRPPGRGPTWCDATTPATTTGGCASPPPPWRRSATGSPRWSTIPAAPPTPPPTSPTSPSPARPAPCRWWRAPGSPTTPSPTSCATTPGSPPSPPPATPGWWWWSSSSTAAPARAGRRRSPSPCMKPTTAQIPIPSLPGASEPRPSLPGLSGLDWGLLAATLLLAAIGLATVHSASDEMPVDYLPRQAMWMGVGIVLLLVALTVNYHSLVDFAVPVYFAGLLALVAVLAFGQGPGGTRSWLVVGGFRVGQPAEFAKLGTALFLARYLAGVNRRHLTFRQLAVAALIVAVPMGLVVLPARPRERRDVRADGRRHGAGRRRAAAPARRRRGGGRSCSAPGSGRSACRATSASG